MACFRRTPCSDVNLGMASQRTKRCCSNLQILPSKRTAATYLPKFYVPLLILHLQHEHCRSSDEALIIESSQATSNSCKTVSNYQPSVPPLGQRSRLYV
eukprot:1875777-Amphidinium_carterae.1